jgi:hypothetical protein
VDPEQIVGLYPQFLVDHAARKEYANPDAGQPVFV